LRYPFLAICASPALVLKAHGIGVNKKMTCYPSFATELDGNYTYVDENVVQDGKLITSKGPATAVAFALKVAEELCGEKAKEVAKGILFE
jgi:putative intracellular protease/amidase